MKSAPSEPAACSFAPAMARAEIEQKILVKATINAMWWGIEDGGYRREYDTRNAHFGTSITVRNKPVYRRAMSGVLYWHHQPIGSEAVYQQSDNRRIQSKTPDQSLVAVLHAVSVPRNKVVKIEYIAMRRMYEMMRHDDNEQEIISARVPEL